MTRSRMLISKSHAVVVVAVALLVSMIFIGSDLADWARLLLACVALAVILFVPRAATSSAPSPSLTARALRVMGWFAAAIVFDLVVCGGLPSGSMIVALVTTVRLVWAMLCGQRDRLRRHGVVLAVAISAIFAVFQANSIVYEIANKRAVTIVAACERYKEQHGSYPDRFDALVAEFRDHVPKAKSAAVLPEFSYFSYKNKHQLMWPPPHSADPIAFSKRSAGATWIEPPAPRSPQNVAVFANASAKAVS